MLRKIEISYKTIVFTVLFLISLFFLYNIKDILLQLFVALLITSILNPTVTKLHKKFKIPRFISVLIVYICVIVFLVISISVIANPLIEQTANFAASAPVYLNELKIPEIWAERAILEVTKELGKLPSQILKIGFSVFNNVLSVFAVFIFALYFLLAREKLSDQLNIMFKNENIEKRIENILSKLETRLGGWARGQMILMFMVGISTYLGLVIIGVPFALPLALLAGILELIPNLGPTLAGIPAVIVGFGVSPLTGVSVLILSVLIQQIENYVFVPKVMEKSAGITPVVTLLSLLIGFKLAGIVGALLSVPVVITLQVIIEEYLDSK